MFWSTAQKHNAQFLEHDSLMPNYTYKKNQETIYIMHLDIAAVENTGSIDTQHIIKTDFLIFNSTLQLGTI